MNNESGFLKEGGAADMAMVAMKKPYVLILRDDEER